MIVQNSDPFTYFRKRPIRVAERRRASTTGRSSLAVLRKRDALELPTLIPRLLSGRPRTVLRHRQVESLPELDTALRVEALDGPPVSGAGGRRLHRRVRRGGVRGGAGGPAHRELSSVVAKDSAQAEPAEQPQQQHCHRDARAQQARRGAAAGRDLDRRRARAVSPGLAGAGLSTAA